MLQTGTWNFSILWADDDGWSVSFDLGAVDCQPGYNVPTPQFWVAEICDDSVWPFTNSPWIFRHLMSWERGHFMSIKPTATKKGIKEIVPLTPPFRSHGINGSRPIETARSMWTTSTMATAKADTLHLIVVTIYCVHRLETNWYTSEFFFQIHLCSWPFSRERRLPLRLSSIIIIGKCHFGRIPLLSKVSFSILYLTFSLLQNF